MPRTTLSELFQKPFDVLEELVADDSPPRSVYSGVRNRAEGLYTQTNTQPGTGLYAADRSIKTEENATGAGRDSVRADAFDCPDPVTCDTCSPPATTAD